MFVLRGILISIGVLAVLMGMLWIGQGTGDPQSPHDQGLDAPTYDFNDEALSLIIDYMAELVETKLKI